MESFHLVAGGLSAGCAYASDERSHNDRGEDATEHRNGQVRLALPVIGHLEVEADAEEQRQHEPPADEEREKHHDQALLLSGRNRGDQVHDDEDRCCLHDALAHNELGQSLAVEEHFDLRVGGDTLPKKGKKSINTTNT